MAKDTFRVVTRGPDGKIRMRDYDAPDSLLRMHTQIGVDDCSTDLGLRGQPVFRGLIGPMPEGKNVIRYESPEAGCCQQLQPSYRGDFTEFVVPALFLRAEVHLSK